MADLVPFLSHKVHKPDKELTNRASFDLLHVIHVLRLCCPCLLLYLTVGAYCCYYKVPI